MQKIIDFINKVDRVEKIILSNNNPDIKIEEWVNEQDKLTIINQKEKTLYTKRFEIAASLGYKYFFCPDDDIFLLPAQINHVLDKLQENPHVAHGVYGQIGVYINGELDMQKGSGVFGVSCEVDVLNRAYFFTSEHIKKCMLLVNEMGWHSINEAIYMEDSLISFSGSGKPICHNVGHIFDCETSTQQGVATYLEENFSNIRLDGYLKLQHIAEMDAMREKQKIYFS
jgi:hypothetical protein